MRAPSTHVVLDSSIILAGVVGRNSRTILRIASRRVLVTTDRALVEVRRRIHLGLRRPDLLDALPGLVETVEIVPVFEVSDRLEDCARRLREAVPSRDQSSTDSHLLALADTLEADIWSFDRDFAGTGVASWSTFNLFAALDQEREFD